MSVVLITGAFGFVGTNLSSWLAAHGHRVLALDVAAQVPSAYAEFRTWDALDGFDWGAVDAVIHLAGKAHDTRKAVDPQMYFDINVGLTKRIFDRFCDSRARTFLFFSSVKAVADQVPVGSVLTEDAVPDPRTPYGKSKLAAEQYLQAVPLAADRRLYILRPCMIHGPGNKGNLNLLYGFARRGLPYPLAAFENRRSFTAIENVCQAVDGLLRLAPASGIYQLADDEPLSTNTVMTLMAESLGRQPRSWHCPPAIIRWCARVGDRLHLPLNSERLDKLTESYVVDNRKLRRALGVARFPVTAEDGLRKTLAAFRG
ncbi:MAG: NAD-dependent epimerase/dehydratase family protein [Kiritimatiellia bacterium]